MIFLFLGSVMVIFRGAQLFEHFETNVDNLQLDEDDQFEYISYPVFVRNMKESKEDVPRFISNFREPVQFLQCLWTHEIMEHICEETGVFKCDKKDCRLPVNDLKVFLGMELIRGISGIRNVKYLFGADGITLDFPHKEKCMTRNYWFAVSSALSFDALFVHTSLVERFKSHLVPGDHLCVDELRIPIQHQSCPFKNHNVKKPDPWAIESKSLHANNGFLLDFVFPLVDKPPTPREAVFEFACYLRNTGRKHHLVMDSNFLSALDLLQLKEKSILATVSCKRDRPSWIWKDGLEKDLPFTYTRVASSTHMCCVATNNQGIPKLATTLFHAVDDEENYESSQRRSILNLYDSLKDRADKFGQLYKAQFPSGHHKSWNTTLLVGWFYFALTNAYILYSTKYDDLTHKQFVFQIANNFLDV